MKSICSLGAFITILSVFFSSAEAHDFFLYPSQFCLKPGDSLRLYIHVSDTFPGVPQNWNPERVLQFTHISHTDAADLTTITPHGVPAGAVLALPDSGTHLFALNWKARLIELRPDQFLHYLQAEGLNHIIELREQRGETGKPGRERYTRYVKTLVQVGDEYSSAFQEPVGQKIEIIPRTNPYILAVGDSLPVQVLFEGQPLQNALVSATYAGFTNRPDTYAQSVRTNKEGIAFFGITQPGPWMTRIVHMVPLQNSTEADWESFWASLTFEIR